MGFIHWPISIWTIQIFKYFSKWLFSRSHGFFSNNGFVWFPMLSINLDNGKLKGNLVLDVDVKSINEKLFDTLSGWYGVKCPKNDVPYREIYKTDKNNFTFDLYPPSIQLVSREGHTSFEIKCCSHETIGELLLILIFLLKVILNHASGKDIISNLMQKYTSGMLKIGMNWLRMNP